MIKKTKICKLNIKKDIIILEDYKAPGTSEDMSDLLGVKDTFKALGDVAKFSLNGTALAAKIGFNLTRAIFDDTYDLNDVSRDIDRNTLSFISKTNYNINSLDNQTSSMIRKAGISDAAFTALMSGIPGVNLITALNKIDRMKFSSGAAIDSIDTQRIQEPIKALITIMFEQVCPNKEENNITYSSIDLSEPDISIVVRETKEFIKQNIDPKFRSKLYSINDEDLLILSRLYSTQRRSLKVDADMFINQLKSILEKTQISPDMNFENRNILKFNSKNIIMEKKTTSSTDRILKNREKFINILAGLGLSILDKDKKIFNKIVFYYAKDLKNIESLGVNSIDKIYKFASERLFESLNIKYFIESLGEAASENIAKSGEEISKKFSTLYLNKMNEISGIVHEDVKQKVNQSFASKQEDQIKSIFVDEIGKDESGDSINFETLDVSSRADIAINLIESLIQQYNNSEYTIEKDAKLAELIKSNLNKKFITGNFKEVLDKLKGNSSKAITQAASSSIRAINQVRGVESKEKKDKEESSEDNLQTANLGNNTDQEQNK